MMWKELVETYFETWVLPYPMEGHDDPELIRGWLFDESHWNERAGDYENLGDLTDEERNDLVNEIADLARQALIESGIPTTSVAMRG